MTYDSTNGLVGYVNASVDGTGAANGNVATPGTIFQISNNLPVFGGRYFDGVLDEVRVYSTSLTSSWITADFNSQKGSSNFIIWGPKVAVGVVAPFWQVVYK